jgi:putative MATE family efflux protein
MVDTIFIGQGVGAAAMGGVAVVFPIIQFFMGLALIAGIGSASILSRALGTGDPDKAAHAAGNAFFISFIGTTIFVLPCLILLDGLLVLCGANEAIMPYARDYATMILLGMPFIVFFVAVLSLVRAEGRAGISMIVTVTGALSNIVLDAIFIFGFQLGTLGVGLATSLAHVIAVVILVIFYLTRSRLHLKLRHFLLKWSIIQEMFKIGFPEFLKTSLNSLLFIVLNNLLRFFGGEMAITVFGVCFRVLTFSVMPAVGIGQAMQPLAGYNYGANRYGLVRLVIKQAIVSVVIIELVIMTTIMLLPGLVLRAFSNDPEFLQMGSAALRLIIITTPLLSLQFIITSFFQALGRAFALLILNVMRLVVFLIPLALLLPRLLGLAGIWLTFPLADTLALTLSFVWLIRELRRIGEMNLITQRTEP